jgi:hypothetical protein
MRRPDATSLSGRVARRLGLLVLIVPQFILQVRSRRRPGGHTREPQGLAQLLLDRGG